MKVAKAVKEDLQAAQATLGLKTESEALSYVLEVFRRRRPGLTMREHDEILQKVKDDHNQMSM